jgi:integrase
MLDETRDPALTVTAFVEDWLKHHVAVHCKPGTAEKYEMIFRKHWLPAVGQLPLISVTREHIKTVAAEKLGADLKPRTVKGHLDVLRACLSEAVEDKLIPVNPAARLSKLVPRSGDNPEIDIFTRAEVTAFLEVAERHMRDAYPIVLTLARTGLRIGEARTLQSDDVDFAQRTLWVRRTWGSRKKALGDRRINVRRVDMSKQLTHVLQGFLAVREVEAIVKGQERSPWLFLGGGDGPMTPGSFWQNVWCPLLRRAGIRYRKPHTLRHTYASLLIQNGESLAYIRDQLGHHSIKLTVDT